MKTKPQPSESLRHRVVQEHVHIRRFAVVFIFLSILGALHIGENRPLSPIDEQTHLDYVLKAGQLQLPGVDERLSQDTMRIMACTTLDSPVYISPCELEKFDSDAFPDLGFNTASEAAPTFYLATGLLARTLRIFTPVEGLLPSARLANWVWIAAAGALLHVVLRRRKVSSSVAISLSLLLVLNPVSIAAGTHVSPDSAMPLAGLVMFLLVESPRRSAWRSVGLAAMVGALTTIDGAMGLAVLLCVFTLVFQIATESRNVISARRQPDTRFLADRLTTFVAVVTGTIVMPKVLDILRNAYAGSLGERMTALPRDELFQRPDFDIATMLTGFWNIFPPVGGGYIVPPLRGLDALFVTQLLGFAILGGVLAYLAQQTSVRTQATAVAVALTGIFSYPLLNLMLWSRGGSFWVLAPRFGLAPLAVYFILAGLAFRSTASKFAITALGVSTLFISLLNILFT